VTEQERPLTREDVLKLIEEHGGPGGLDLSGRRFEAGIDLSGKNLQGIILENATFPVFFQRFVGEPSRSVDVDRGAQLEGANLYAANLKGASLRFANLKAADLRAANLEGCKLGSAKLAKAKLYGAEISGQTRLEDVYWGPISTFSLKFILGEEEAKEFEHARQVYCMLKQWHTNRGIYDIAGGFYYREMEAIRKARIRGRNLPLKLWSELLRILCGYGEKPWRVAVWAALVVLSMAGIFSATALTFPSSLYYSAASFTALGYGLWVHNPDDWVKALGAVEAFVGVFMIALFLITFVRKMTR